MLNRKCSGAYLAEESEAVIVLAPPPSICQGMADKMAQSGRLQVLESSSYFAKMVVERTMRSN